MSVYVRLHDCVYTCACTLGACVCTYAVRWPPSTHVHVRHSQAAGSTPSGALRANSLKFQPGDHTPPYVQLTMAEQGRAAERRGGGGGRESAAKATGR